MKKTIKKWLESISDEQIELFAARICDFFGKPIVKAFLVYEAYCIAARYDIPFIREFICIYILYKIFDRTTIVITRGQLERIIKYIEERINK